MSNVSKNAQEPPVETIITAADHGCLDLVTKLLEDGIDPNTVDELGTSALHNAAKRGHWHIARLLAGHKQVVRLLLECDPATCILKENGRNEPIFIAVARGYADIVQNLLDCGAMTLGPKGDDTPLHVAAKKGYSDICEALLKHDKGLARSVWERLVGPSLQVDSKDYYGTTPFAYAEQQGHHRTVEVFLDHYPELVKACDREKKLLFHRAIGMRKTEIVQTFLSHGADVQMKDNNGRTALHMAVITGDTEMIKLTLAHGATVDVKDKWGVTPGFMTSDPKTRMILRNHENAHSKGPALSRGSTATAPPPEYKA